MEKILGLSERLGEAVWGWPMIALLVGTHLYMTFKTGFIQKKIFTGIRLSVKNDGGAKGDISQFGSLATSLASTLGTGNIIGVGTAISLGGPGAILWMWITGVLGIATKYAESLLAVKYRVKSEDETMKGGAMYVLENALGAKWLGVIFSAAGAMAGLGIGCSVQSNAIADTLKSSMGVPMWITGVITAFLTFVVIVGGVKKITCVCEKLVPFMAAFYMLGCGIILFINRDFIFDAIKIICDSAFTTRAAAGGFAGSTLMVAARWGIARGLFSNEAGMGSSPIISAAAKTKNPVRQALVASTGVFWDTVVMCFITGLVLITTIISYPQGEILIKDGGDLAYMAFGKIPYIGEPILVFGVVTFAFATILSWCYYGEKCTEYLFGKRYIFVYRMIWVFMTFFGCITGMRIVWSISDSLNAIMAIPSLLSVLFLGSVVSTETKKYINNLDMYQSDE